jgi:hypothetical protein
MQKHRHLPLRRLFVGVRFAAGSYPLASPLLPVLSAFSGLHSALATAVTG